MRHPSGRMFMVLAFGFAAIATVVHAGRADDFQVSYAAGSRDEAGRFAGGTEMRLLVPYAGRLYAGNGYWEDRPGPGGLQGEQIRGLGTPRGRWRGGHVFAETVASG